jgi:hypothetical protein
MVYDLQETLPLTLPIHFNIFSSFFLSCADEQFVLKRVADSAIDIYGMVATLSRVSRSLKQNLPSAAHEQLICQVWCDEVSKAR